MKKSKLYTRTGDGGTTSLIGGKRVAKNHLRLNAYGTIDELNSFLGMLCSQPINEKDKANLLKIQQELFAVGGSLACEDTEKTYSPCPLTDESIKWLENEIDLIDNELEPLRDFVIPPDDFAASLCHVCRTVCRRAERTMYDLKETTEVAEQVTAYINRLSDYLFVLSRKIAERRCDKKN